MFYHNIRVPIWFCVKKKKKKLNSNVKHNLTRSGKTVKSLRKFIDVAIIKTIRIIRERIGLYKIFKTRELIPR